MVWWFGLTCILVRWPGFNLWKVNRKLPVKTNHQDHRKVLYRVSCMGHSTLYLCRQGACGTLPNSWQVTEILDVGSILGWVAVGVDRSPWLCPILLLLFIGFDVRHVLAKGWPSGISLRTISLATTTAVEVFNNAKAAMRYGEPANFSCKVPCLYKQFD